MKPILFIDFDRTLFDTDRFYDWLGEDRIPRVLGIVNGTVEPPDFRAMLYPDAVDFLVAMRERFRLVILTFDTNEGLQRKKLQGSGVVAMVDDIIITRGDKGEEAARYLARLPSSGWRNAFIDDRYDYIESMKDRNPGIHTILIRRGGDSPLGEGEPKADAAVRDLGEAAVALALFR